MITKRRPASSANLLVIYNTNKTLISLLSYLIMVKLLTTAAIAITAPRIIVIVSIFLILSFFDSARDNLCSVLFYYPAVNPEHQRCTVFVLLIDQSLQARNYGLAKV